MGELISHRENKRRGESKQHTSSKCLSCLTAIHIAQGHREPAAHYNYATRRYSATIYESIKIDKH